MCNRCREDVQKPVDKYLPWNWWDDRMDPIPPDFPSPNQYGKIRTDTHRAHSPRGIIQGRTTQHSELALPTIPANTFLNILRLEERKGFTDAAVAGGLEAFARRWAEQIAPSNKAAADVISNAFAGYSRIDPQARQAAVRRATDLLAGLENGSRDLPAHGNGRDAARAYAPPPIEGFTGYDEDDSRAKPPVSSYRANVAPAPTELPPQPASARAARRNATLDSPVTVLRGVQTANARLLKRLGVYTVRDALLFFPFRYDDFSALKPIAQLEPGVNQTVVGTIWDVEARKTRNGRPLITATLADDAGTISVSWFNQEYLLKSL